MRDTAQSYKTKETKSVQEERKPSEDMKHMQETIEKLRLSKGQKEAMKNRGELDSLWGKISKRPNGPELKEIYDNAIKDVALGSYHVGSYAKLETVMSSLEFYNQQMDRANLDFEDITLRDKVMGALDAHKKELNLNREYQLKNGVAYSIVNMEYDHSMTLQYEAELFFKIALVNKKEVAVANIAKSILEDARFDSVKELGIGFTPGQTYSIDTDPKKSVLGRTTSVAVGLVNGGKSLDATDWSRFSKADYTAGNVFARTDEIYGEMGYSTQSLDSISSLWSDCITSQKRVLDMNTFSHPGIMPEGDFTLDEGIRRRYTSTKKMIYDEFDALVKLGSGIADCIDNKRYPKLKELVDPYRALRELADQKKYKELKELSKIYSEVVKLIWPEMHMMGSNRLAHAITVRSDVDEFNKALSEAELIPIGLKKVLSVAPEFIEPIIKKYESITSAKDFTVLAPQIVWDSRKGPDVRVDEAELKSDLEKASESIINELVGLEKNNDFEVKGLSDASKMMLRAVIYKPIIFSCLVKTIGADGYDSFPVSTDYFRNVLISSKGKVTAETYEEEARMIVWQKVRSLTLQFNTIFERVLAKPTIDAGVSSLDYTVRPFVHDMKGNRLEVDMKVMPKEERLVPYVRAELDVFREARGDQISLNWKEFDSIASDPKKAGFKLKESTKAKGKVAAVFAERGYSPETEIWEGKDGRVLVRGFYKDKPVILTSSMDSALTRHREINVLLGEGNPKREVSYRPGAKRYVKYAVEIDPDGPGYLKPPLKFSDEVFNTVDPLFEFAAAPPNAKKVSATVPALSGVALGTLEADHAIQGKLTAYQQQLEAIKRMFKDSSSYTAANMPVFESRVRAADQLLASAVAVTLNNITADPAHKLTQKDGSDLTPAQLGVLNNFVQSGRSDKAVRDAIRQTSLYRMIPSEEEMNAIISSVYNLRIFSVILKKEGITLLPSWAPKGWTVVPKLSLHGVLLGDVVEQVQGSSSINNTSFTPSGGIIGTQQTFSNDIAVKQHAVVAGPELAVTSAGGTRLANISFATSVKGPLSIQLLNVTGAGAAVLNNTVHRFRTDLKRPWFGYFTDLAASIGEGVNFQMMRVEKDMFIRLESNLIELPLGDYIRPVIPYFRNKSVPTFDLKISHIYEKQINKGLFGDDYVDKKSFAAIASSFNFEKFGVDAKPIFSLGGKTDLKGYRLNTWFGKDRTVEMFFEQRLNPGQDSYTMAFQYKFDGGFLNDFDPYAWLKKKFEKKDGDSKAVSFAK